MNDDKRNPDTKVDVNIVLRAIKELNASPSLLALQNASLHQKIFLASVIKKVRMAGISDIDYSHVIDEHSRICSSKAIELPSFTDLHALALSLSFFGWISIEDKPHGISKKVICHIE